jgi:hypothetical protein
MSTVAGNGTAGYSGVGPVVVLDGSGVGAMIVVGGFAECCMILRGGAAAASMLRCKVVMGGVMLLADDYIDVEDAAVVTELHGKYYEQAYRGNVFTATMTSSVILPAPASTAFNPITLANPAGSGKNVSLIRFEMVLTAAIGTPFIGTYGLFVNTNVVAAALSGTALTPIPALVGSNDRCADECPPRQPRGPGRGRAWRPGAVVHAVRRITPGATLRLGGPAVPES